MPYTTLAHTCACHSGGNEVFEDSRAKDANLGNFLDRKQVLEWSTRLASPANNQFTGSAVHGTGGPYKFSGVYIHVHVCVLCCVVHGVCCVCLCTQECWRSTHRNPLESFKVRPLHRRQAACAHYIGRRVLVLGKEAPQWRETPKGGKEEGRGMT